MEFTAAAVVPALATLAAAFVAGGIARSNLIVSKESKISEFRQAWSADLRENLSSLFSSVRLLARAVQEEREMERGNGSNPKFHFSQEKVIETRQLSSETKYRIELLLDENVQSHVELGRLLEEMMAVQNMYLGKHDADIESVFSAMGGASGQAAVVLAQEWEKVRLGEDEYRNAVKTANSVLLVAGMLLFALTVVAFFSPLKATKVATPARVSQPASASNVASMDIPVPTAAKSSDPEHPAHQTSLADGSVSQTVAACAGTSVPARR